MYEGFHTKDTKDVFHAKNARISQGTQELQSEKQIGEAMAEDELAKIVFHSGMKIHKTLGPGLLESVYEECLFYEIEKHGLVVAKQVPLPVVYENIKLDGGFRVDLLVEKKLIIEIKSVEELHKLHFAQVLTYLRLSNIKLGLLINFNTNMFKDGVKRVANGL